MSQKRNDACLKINAITQRIYGLREYLRFDGLPPHKAADELMEIGYDLNELFWLVDSIKTAEDLADELARASKEIRGLR